MIIRRYTISDELWMSFSIEQVDKQVERLKATGRWFAPNSGGPIVVRSSYFANFADSRFEDGRKEFEAEGGTISPNDSNAQNFFDFEFSGGDDPSFVRSQLVRRRVLGSMNWTPERRQAYVKTAVERFGEKYNPPKSTWWERDFACARFIPEQPEAWADIAVKAFQIVVILLQDRATNTVEIEPRRSPKLKLAFLKNRAAIPDWENLPEIVLTIPRRIYASPEGKKHNSPRMHFRAEHVRLQPYGPRSAPMYREITIGSTWINATDIDPAELGTPITQRNYRFVGTAPARRRDVSPAK